MSITVTRHEVLSRDILGAQIGDKITIATGEVSEGFAAEGFYRLKALADCVMRIGDDLDDAADGEDWTESDTDVRLIKAGQVIAVDAAA